MSKQKQFQFTYPPNEELCLKHRFATRIFKGIIKDQYNQIQKCQCCGKAIGNQYVQDQFLYDYHQLSFLGVGIPLYFSFIKSSVLLLLLLCILFCLFAILFHFTKDNCRRDAIQCKLNILQTFQVGNQRVNYRNFVSIQNYILLVFVVITILLFQYLRYKFRKIEKESDQFNDTPSDYALILKRLPQDIQISDIELMIQERRGFLSQQQKKNTDNLKVEKIVLSWDLSQYTKVKNQNISTFKKLIKQNKYQNFIQPKLPIPKKTASIAIVVFSHQCSKDFFIERPKFKQRALNFFLRSLTPLSDYYVKGKRITIQRAPEPDDIIWQNANVSIFQSIIRKLFFGSLSFLFLLITGYSQYRLALRHSKTQSETTKDFLHVLSSFLVHFTNVMIKQYMIKSVHWQKLSTQTERMQLQTTKICVLQFLNSGIVVAIANILANGQLFQLDIEFVQKATHIMTVNATMPILTHFFINYLDIIGKIKRFLMHHKIIICTQLEANKIYQLPSPRIPNQYAYVMKTLWLTAFYAAFSPIVVPISTGALLVYYIIQKRLFHGSYSAPHMMSSIVNQQAFQLFEYFPLIMSIGMFYLYIDFLNYQPNLLPENWSTPVIISLVLCLANLISPTKELNLLIEYKKMQKPRQPLYQQIQKDFEVTYDMTNPMCKSKRKRLTDIYVWKQLFGHAYEHQDPQNSKQENYSQQMQDVHQNFIFNRLIKQNNQKRNNQYLKSQNDQNKTIDYSKLKLKKQNSFGIDIDKIFGSNEKKQKKC